MPVATKAAARAHESRLKKKKGDTEKMESAGMGRWLLTYADMITLLLALFIILFSISTINKVKYQALVHDISGGFNSEWAINNPPNGGQVGAKTGGPSTSSLKQIQVELQAYVKQHGLQDKVKTKFQRDDLIISLLTDKALYDSGSAQLRPGTQKVLDEIGGFLRRAHADIRVEGHTDNIPIATSEFPTNWELSAARAVTVTRFLVEQDHVDPNRISAAGYGQFAPTHPNATEAERQLNRRVDIVVHSQHG